MVKFALSDGISEGAYDTDELYEIISQCIDEDKIRKSPVKFGLMTVEIPNMKPWGMMTEDIEKGKLHDFLMASCSCYPVFKPWTIDGKKFIDGGYYDNLPINLAIDHGAEDIVAVDLEAVGFNKEAKKEEYPILKIRPYWNLGAVFDFEKSSYERNKTFGYNDTMKAYGFLEGLFFTFKRGECRKNYNHLKNQMGRTEKTVEQMLLRPVSRAMQTLDRKSVNGFLSGGSFLRDPSEMLCRISETAGIVMKVSPLQQYTYKVYNDAVLREYLKYGGALEGLDKIGVEITGILSAIGRAMDNRRITALIVEMLLRQKDISESMWTLAEVMPREFSAAVYISMLIEAMGINPA